jgi:hypothetical protein
MPTPDELANKIEIAGAEHMKEYGIAPTPREGNYNDGKTKNKSWDRMTRYGDDVPHAFLQCMGTDVCMDFYCSCGGGGHIDGMFAYYVKCSDCGQVYASPAYIGGFVPLLEGEEPDHDPYLADDDED